MLGFAWVCSCSTLRFLKRLVTSCEDLLKHIMCLHTFIERVIHSIRVSCLIKQNSYNDNFFRSGDQKNKEIYITGKNWGISCTSTLSELEKQLLSRDLRLSLAKRPQKLLMKTWPLSNIGLYYSSFLWGLKP